MANFFIRVWKDPVWSKVIAAGILAAVSILARVIAPHLGPAYEYVSYPMPLWLTFIIVAISFAVGSSVASGRSNRSYGFDPTVKLDAATAPDPNPVKTLAHPVKIWWTLRNDSPGCIEVSFSDFREKNIKLEGKPPGVLQVLMGQQWLPADHGLDKIAVLPGQTFKGWVPVDQTLYTAAHVRGQMKNLGTLVLNVNGSLFEFEL